MIVLLMQWYVAKLSKVTLFDVPQDDAVAFLVGEYHKHI